MDPDAVKSTLSNLAFGNVLAAAARDYQKELDLVAQNKANASSSVNDEVDIDELMDKDAEKRQELKMQDHGGIQGDNRRGLFG